MLKNFKILIFKFLIVFLFASCEVYHGNGIAVLATDLDFNTTDTNDTNTTTSSYLLKIINSKKVEEIKIALNIDEVFSFKNIELKNEFNPQEIENKILFLKNINYENKYLEIQAFETGKTILSISKDYNISIVVK